MLGLHTDLLLVDGMNLIFKGYYVMTNLSTSSGDPTNIIYSFLQSLSTTAGKYHPQGIIVCWEGIGSNDYRRAIYDGYKGDRKEKATKIDWNNVHQQIDTVRDFLSDLGVGTATIPYKEADDTIASFCLAYPEKNIVINSSDNDFLQLITSQIRWFNGTKEVNIKNFYREMGVSLDRFLDYRVLTGDKSDCIPGIKGIGEKTAKILLNKIDLDKYMENYNKESALARTGNLFAPNASDIVWRNRKLMNLKLHVNSKVDLKPVVEKSCLDIGSIAEGLEDLEMWSILDNMDEFVDPFTRQDLESVLNG